MAIVKGICKNIENCDKAENKEIQDIEKSAPFVCQECGKPLVPAFTTRDGGTPNNFRRNLLILIVVVILTGCGIGGYFYTTSTPPPPPPPPPTEDSVKIKNRDTALLPEEPSSPSVTLQSCLNEGTLSDESNGVGTISTPYGNYKGELKDGKANGNGTFQFFKTCRISKHDNQERSGETGDYLVGQFADNEVITAKWLNKDKEQKGTIIIGKTGV